MSLKLKNRFWISAILFSVFFAGAVLAGGLYLSTLQENKKAKTGIKKSLRRQSAVYLENLENRLSKFQREARRLIDGGGGASPLFSALLLLGDQTAPRQLVPAPPDSLGEAGLFYPSPPPLSVGAMSRKGGRQGDRKKSFETMSSLPPPSPPLLSEKLMKDFLIFADSLKKNPPPAPFSVHFLPVPPDGEEGWMVFSGTAQKESRDLRWAALIKNSDLFPFSKASDREALIINSQGRLFFSFHPKAARPPPSKPVLKKLLKTGGKTSGRFVRLKGGNFQANNFFHIKPWPETNLFVLSAARFSKRAFVWPETGPLWLVFCLGLFALLFLGLLFVIRPLALRPSRRRGSLPFVETAVPAPGLFPHKPSPRPPETHPKSPPFPSFQDLLKAEEKHLRKKFPGFILKTRLETNINTTHFYRPLKKILRELILNGIESMGGAEIQEITVSAREEGGKFILSVWDRGPGLSPRERKKAFNLYYSTKSHLGVGLNVAQSLVSFHGGELKLSSLSEEDPSQTGLKVQVSFPVGCFAPPQKANPFVGGMGIQGAGRDKRNLPAGGLSRNGAVSL